MTSKLQTTRRDFLAASATVAALGLTGEATRGRDELKVVAGPKPKPLAKDKPIRLGFIGCGSRHVQLLNQVLKHKNVEIKAIVDPDPARIENTLGIIYQVNKQKPEVYRGETDYREKLLARDDLDAVVNAAPIWMHAPMYLDTFAAGKHFYGEKPMCIEVGHANLLVEAQKKNPHVKAQIGFQRRACPLFHEGIKAIDDGMIGPVIGCYAGWNVHYGPLGLPSDGYQVWFGRRACSGDWMLEQACHTWDVINWVAGSLPVAAWGKGRRDIWTHIDPERDVTDFYFAQLEYPNGMLVDFQHCWFTPTPDRDPDHRFRETFTRFLGSKGGITLSKYEARARFIPRDPTGKVCDIATDDGDRSDEHSMNAFFRSLENDAPVCSTVENGRDATLVGLLVREGVDRNARVEMKEILAGV